MPSFMMGSTLSKWKNNTHKLLYNTAVIGYRRRRLALQFPQNIYFNFQWCPRFKSRSSKLYINSTQKKNMSMMLANTLSHIHFDRVLY
jgi:hypothetical protein